MDDTFLAKYQLGYGTASNTGNTWSKHHNEQGIPYYYNTATKASAWTLPEGATVVDTAAAQAATGTSMTGAATLTYEQLVDRKRNDNFGKVKKQQAHLEWELAAVKSS